MASPDVDHLLQTQLQGLQRADPVILSKNKYLYSMNIESKLKKKELASNPAMDIYCQIFSISFFVQLCDFVFVPVSQSS